MGGSKVLAHRNSWFGAIKCRSSRLRSDQKKGHICIFIFIVSVGEWVDVFPLLFMPFLSAMLQDLSISPSRSGVQQHALYIRVALPKASWKTARNIQKHVLSAKNGGLLSGSPYMVCNLLLYSVGPPNDS